MHQRFIAFAYLAATLALTGCQSRVTNIGVSRNSEAGRAISRMDDSERQYQQNVEVYTQAMIDYEKMHGDSCRNIMFSSIVGPMQTPEPRVQICKLQSSSHGCGYRNYKAKITYVDDACHVVKTVEIQERITQ